MCSRCPYLSGQQHDMVSTWEVWPTLSQREKHSHLHHFTKTFASKIPTHTKHFTMSLLSTSFPVATVSFPSRNNLLPTLDQLKTSTTKPLEHHHHLVLHSPPPRLVLVRCSSQQRQQSQEFQFERLFSNLNKATLKREPGSLSSSIFLVAGTTVGAGILAIPAVTQEAGFLASAVACILCWIFMVVTGLLIAEVNVNTMCELGSGGVSLVSMATRTLGTVGVQIACWSYIFIHYALLVAYVARSSDILAHFLGIPLWETATLFSLVLGGLCYFGSQRIIGAVNGVLVFGIIISFTALVVVASGDLQWNALLKANFEAVPMSIPIIALSFVYQNVVPVLCTNLEGNLSKVRTSIVLGTAIPLALFLVWNAVILGSITGSDMVSGQMIDPLEQLRSSNGLVGPIIELFSFLAIATSYIGFVLGLSDFLADLLKLPAGESSPQPYLLTLIPPLVLSLLDPEIFFKALDFAGTYGVLVLFGILPAAMCWSDRYSDSSPSMKLPQLVPGGRITLALVMGGAGYIILSEILEKFN